MKVVLVQAPENWIVKAYLPNLGALYIAAYLEAHGHHVHYLDANAQKMSVDETVQKVKMLQPDVIGVSAHTHNRFKAIELIAKLKEKIGVPIIAGGAHFGRAPQDALLHVPGIDVIFREEGEATTAELMDAIENKKDFQTIRGINYRDASGKLMQTPPREFLKNLDELPFPAYHLIDFSKYDAHLEDEVMAQDGEKTKTIGVVSGRGCPNECEFCTDAGFKAFRLRSPKNFVDELEIMHTRYGFNAFDIWDDTFTIDRRHVEAVCHEIKERKLDIQWYARARVNTVNREILDTMHGAGCRIIGYGVESGSQKVLNIMKKRITVEQVLLAVQATADAGIKCKTFWMHSLPGETLADVKMTLDLMKKVWKISDPGKTPPPHANFATLYPGTALEFRAKQEGFFPENFSWNTYYEFAAPKLINMDATVPLYEQPNLKIEQILAFCYSQNTGFVEMVRKSWRATKRIKNMKDLRAMIRIGMGYFVRPNIDETPSLFTNEMKKEPVNANPILAGK